MGPTRLASALVSVPIAARRIALAIAPRLINRRFAFALAAAAIFVSKVVHIYFHLSAIPSNDLVRWGFSFFLQDTLVLILLRLLIDGQAAATVAASSLISFVLLLAFVSLTFAATTSSELQWRNVTLAGDSSSWGMIATGLLSAALITGGLLVAAALTQPIFYTLAGVALDLVKWPLVALFSSFSTLRRPSPAMSEYKHLPQKDVEGSPESSYQSDDGWESSSQDLASGSARSTRLLYFVVSVGIFVQVFTTLFRPDDMSLVYMSWTLPLMPFVDFAHSSPTLTSLLASSSNVNGTLDNATALASPIPFPWLPNDTPLPGFEDWYTDGSTHYSAKADPLKISNLDDPLIPALRAINLANVPIRHVMLIKLESTRKDVFPIKKGGMPWERLAGTHKDKILPEERANFLANLTPTAKLLTGDHQDGFESHGSVAEPAKRRGGINANNAYTTSTYTLKSLAGTICGLSPLAADFNIEQAHHIYQPCLPHIFGALDSLKEAQHGSGKEGDYTSYKWRSSFMQSVTFRYDKQDKLMPRLGYTDDNLMDWWYLKGTPKFGPVNISDINYYGMPEVAIEDYIRDAFDMAKENNERVFLSHLTSTTHHGFGMPEEEKYVSLTNDKDWDDLSHYLNAVGYVDRWLSKILGILEEKGVANETLLVLVGDHGLSIAERGTITPYSNPHVANYHVPLVMSHPKLPPINIDDAVHSLQILPTILDLLVETGSLSESETQAARDLARNYEGQSLLRPLRKYSEHNGQGSWQVTVMNPGGSTLAVRDARQPSWRLIVPVFGNYEWRFTDLSTDPREEHPISSFDLKALMRSLGSDNGTVTSKWVEEAAVVTQWWAGENYKRWRYQP